MPAVSIAGDELEFNRDAARMQPRTGAIDVAAFTCASQN
jgi:hypothetical protein